MYVMTILILQTWLIGLNISHIQCKHEQLLIQTLHVTEHSGNLTKNLPSSLSTKFYYDWWPKLDIHVYIPSNFHYCSLYSANNKSLLSSDLVAYVLTWSPSCSKLTRKLNILKKFLKEFGQIWKWSYYYTKTLPSTM